MQGNELIQPYHQRLREYGFAWHEYRLGQMFLYCFNNKDTFNKDCLNKKFY